MTMPPRASSRTLNGWKEIAAYLGKSVRSVQRWEATLGLPVHRIHTPDGHIVYAEPDEIDLWRQNLESAGRSDIISAADLPAAEPQPRGAERWLRRPPLWVQGVAAVALFAAGAFWRSSLTTPGATPVTFNLAGRVLEALTPDGAVAWSHRFDRDVTRVANRGTRTEIQQLDVNGDGELEILVFVRFGQPGRAPMNSDGLFCFARDGTLEWSVIPDQTLVFGERVFAPPWVLRDVAISGSPGTRRIWLALAHQTWWPGFVLEVSGRDGAARVRYTQEGSIFAIVHWMTPSGGVLAAGGVSRDSSEATVALLPDADPPASFDGSTGGAAACLRCPPGRPRRVLAFSGAELSRLVTGRHPFVSDLLISGTDLKIRFNLGLDPTGTHMVAEVGPDQRLRSISLADAYWRAHEELHKAGSIDHRGADCPERGTAHTARQWTAADGWSEVSVAADPASQ